MPFKLTKESKTQNFQYNFIHRNITTNTFLLKCKIVESSLCSFCNEAIETIDHLFWECFYTQRFWNQVRKYINNKDIQEEITKTITFMCISNNTAVSEILLHAKYYIFKSKCKSKNPSFDVFKIKFESRLKLEQNLAQQQEKLEAFKRKWDKFITSDSD